MDVAFSQIYYRLADKILNCRIDTGVIAKLDDHDLENSAPSLTTACCTREHNSGCDQGLATYTEIIANVIRSVFLPPLSRNIVIVLALPLRQLF